MPNSYSEPPDQTIRYWNERGSRLYTNYLYSQPFDYGTDPDTGRDRHPYSPGHSNAKVARVTAVLDDMFHLLEQNYDFSSMVGIINPALYRWRCKPNWADAHARDRLVNKIDAEFTHEFTSHLGRPAWVWEQNNITQEPGFYRLDYWGRLALALRLDSALVPEPTDAVLIPNPEYAAPDNLNWD